MQFYTLGLPILITIFIDQSSKFIVTTFSSNTTQLNSGISFGWFAGNQMMMSFSLLAACILFVSCFQKMWRKQVILLGILLGAILSNVSDRIFFGGVRDWLPVPGISLKNNIADWCIVIVLAVIALQELGFLDFSKKKVT